MEKVDLAAFCVVNRNINDTGVRPRENIAANGDPLESERQLRAQ